jgi:DNA-binding IclR family transcriptional regulator
MATPKSLSTIKSFRILGAFHRRDETLTNAQVSRRSGLPASSVRRLLLTLTDIGAVERASPIHYRLGPLLHSLAHSVHVRDCLAEAARAELAGLSHRLGLPVALAILDNHMVTYLASFAPAGDNTVTPGDQYEAYSSAIGRVLLAVLPQDRLDRFLAAGELVALTPFTITDAAAFRAELDRVRRDGFAVEYEETCLGAASIAVPICDGNGRVHAAICVAEAACHLGQARKDTLCRALLAAAGDIQRRLFPVAANGQAAIRSPRLPRAAVPPGGAKAALAEALS